jgi:hypothetical protein
MKVEVFLDGVGALAEVEFVDEVPEHVALDHRCLVISEGDPEALLDQRMTGDGKRRVRPGSLLVLDARERPEEFFVLIAPCRLYVDSSDLCRFAVRCST